MDSTASKTSAKLVKLLRRNGPTPIASIHALYQSRFRENLDLEGRGIHGSIEAGLLPGIVYRKHENVGYLEAEMTGRTKAAGGRVANSAQTVAAASVTDLASYTAAVEMFVLRAANVTVKTLGQACAGRTVGLRVVQEDRNDKTTGALTHIQASVKSRQVIDASITVCSVGSSSMELGMTGCAVCH